MRGREPQGTVAAGGLRARAERSWRSGWRRSPAPTASRSARTCSVRRTLYDEVNGVAPDLIVYFGDLAWRSVGTVGGDEGIHTFENDTGPDDANHAQDGLLIMAGPGIEPGPADGMHLLDVAPTVLELLGIEVPGSMRGRSLLSSSASDGSSRPAAHPSR